MMKYLAFLILAGISSHTQAQTFSSDAEWHYRYYSGWQIPAEQREGHDRLWVGGDTIIGGVECQVIERERQYYSHSSLDPNAGWQGPYSNALSAQFVYTSGDTTFYFQEGDFYILFILDAMPGDLWTSHVINGEDVNAFAYTYTTRVIQSGTTEFNGEEVRYVDIEGNSEEICSDIWFPLGRIIEGVGFIETPTSNYFFPDFTSILGCAGLSETESFRFSCFSAQDLGVYQIENTCSTFPVGLISDELNVHVHFNSKTSQLIIQGLEDKLEVRIWNMNAQVVVEEETGPQNNVLNLDKLKVGSYIASITGNEGRGSVYRFQVFD